MSIPFHVSIVNLARRNFEFLKEGQEQWENPDEIVSEALIRAKEHQFFLEGTDIPGKHRQGVVDGLRFVLEDLRAFAQTFPLVDSLAEIIQIYENCQQVAAPDETGEDEEQEQEEVGAAGIPAGFQKDLTQISGGG